MMTEVTWSPAFACRATVPPQPRTSSSGCAAMTRTRLGMDGCFAFGLETQASPELIAEGATTETIASGVFQLEQDHRARAARHELSTGGLHRADDRPEHFTGFRVGDRPAIGRQCRVPNPPLSAVERAERAGVGARQRADEVVHGGGGTIPIDAAIGGAAPA